MDTKSPNELCYVLRIWNGATTDLPVCGQRIRREQSPYNSDSRLKEIHISPRLRRVECCRDPFSGFRKLFVHTCTQTHDEPLHHTSGHRAARSTLLAQAAGAESPD